MSVSASFQYVMNSVETLGSEGDSEMSPYTADQEAALVSLAHLQYQCHLPDDIPSSDTRHPFDYFNPPTGAGNLVDSSDEGMLARYSAETSGADSMLDLSLFTREGAELTCVDVAASMLGLEDPLLADKGSFARALSSDVSLSTLDVSAEGERLLLEGGGGLDHFMEEDEFIVERHPARSGEFGPDEVLLGTRDNDVMLLNSAVDVDHCNSLLLDDDLLLCDSQLNLGLDSDDFILDSSEWNCEQVRVGFVRDID